MFFKKEEYKRENLIEEFKNAPKRKLSEIEKQLIFILIEKSKIQRERSMAILNKGFLLFAAFIVIAYLGRFNEIISQIYINILFLVGITVLITSIVLYQGTISNEERNLDAILDSFLKQNGKKS